MKSDVVCVSKQKPRGGTNVCLTVEMCIDDILGCIGHCVGLFEGLKVGMFEVYELFEGLYV